MAKHTVDLKTLVWRSGLFLLLLAGCVAEVPGTGKVEPEAPMPQPSAAEEAAVLASTLQIAMYEYAQEPGGPEPGSRGLGTLVAHDGETLIVTHDHWAHLTPTLHEVEIRNAAGHLLLTLDAAAFRALIAYRDGGTMVLRAPAGLEGLVAAELGAPAGEGDVVWFARREPLSGRKAVEVVAAAVTAVESAALPATVRLRNLDGSAIVPGDSGGGVWANGRLVGNLWAASLTKKRTFWSELFGGDEAEPSDLAIAALQPLSGQAGADTAVEVLASSDHPDLVDGAERRMLAKEQSLRVTLPAD